MNKNSIVYTIIFTFITAFFFVFFLSLADGATKELVEQNKIVSIQRSILKALDILPAEEDQISSRYNEEFSIVPQPGDQIETMKDGETILIRYFSGSGLWGTITGIIAVSASIDRIVGIDIVSHNETPGLGGRIDEEWFKEQFRDELIGEDGITVVKGTGAEDTDRGNSSVDGITGASLTSSSIEKIINGELEYFRSERSSK